MLSFISELGFLLPVSSAPVLDALHGTEQHLSLTNRSVFSGKGACLHCNFPYDTKHLNLHLFYMSSFRWTEKWGRTCAFPRIKHSQQSNFPYYIFNMVSFSHNQIPHPVQNRDKHNPASICRAPFKKQGTLPINLESLWSKPLTFRKR